MSGSINGLLDRSLIESQYLPFSVGVDQSIYSKQVEQNKSWEIIGEMGVFTQFEWKTMNDIQQRNLINVDYKIAFSFAKKINRRSTYRLRAFHVSSHLGDDYIIRNSIRKYTENKVNYEQLEFTYFYNFINSKARLITGVGSVIRPNAIRLPLSYIIGLESLAIYSDKTWGITSGVVVKGFQETNFNLNLKAGVGLVYQKEKSDDPFRIILEYYTGHLPYSQFEEQKIEWIGVGVYFTI